MDKIVDFIAAHVFWAHLLWTVGCLVLLVACLPLLWVRPRFDRRSGPLGRRPWDQPWFERDIYVDFFKRRGYHLTSEDVDELFSDIIKRGETYGKQIH